MRPAELILKELATLVDIDELSMVRAGVDFDEVESLCRSVVRMLGEERGRRLLVKLAGRIAVVSPELSRRILRHGRRGGGWGTG